MAFVELWYFTR